MYEINRKRSRRLKRNYDSIFSVTLIGLLMILGTIIVGLMILYNIEIEIDRDKLKTVLLCLGFSGIFIGMYSSGRN